MDTSDLPCGDLSHVRDPDGYVDPSDPFVSDTPNYGATGAREWDPADLCYYCGVPSSTIDHTIPRTLLNRLSREELADLFAIKRLTVPACQECNSLIGASVHRTLAARKTYLKQRLEAKYGKFLRMPEWSEGEIDEMGPRMQDHLRWAMATKRVIEARMRF